MTRRFALLVLCAGLLTGCAGQPEALPEVDLDDPDWQVWTGQASWQRPGSTEPIAGELLAALGPDNQVMVTFSKAYPCRIPGSLTMVMEP